MSDDIKTLTVDELIAYLTHFPQDTKVFLSRDSEGNGFGTLNNQGWGAEYHKEDSAMVLFPNQEGLEYDDVFPKFWESEEEKESHDE